MMTVRIDVWSDFVCPFCFAAACSLDLLKATHDVNVHWRSYELRPEGSVIPAWYEEKIIASRPGLATMMRETYGVDIKFGPLGISSRRALIGAKYAEAQGEAIGQLYHRRVSAAYWLEGRSIADDALLEQIAVKTGMDGTLFRAALDDSHYEMLVSVDIEMAQTMGITGVPALVFDKKYLVSGAQPVDVLRDVVEQVKAGEAGLSAEG